MKRRNFLGLAIAAAAHATGASVGWSRSLADLVCHGHEELSVEKRKGRAILVTDVDGPSRELFIKWLPMQVLWGVESRR